MIALCTISLTLANVMSRHKGGPLGSRETATLLLLLKGLSNIDGRADCYSCRSESLYSAFSYQAVCTYVSSLG